MNLLNRTIVERPEYFSSAYLPVTNDRVDDLLTNLHLRSLATFDKLPLAEKHRLIDLKLQHLITSSHELPLWKDLSLPSISTTKEVKDLPITNKDTYRAQPIERRTNLRLAERFGVETRTSGSTGEPLEFYIDGRLRVRQRALLARTMRRQRFYIQQLVNLWPSHNPNPLFGKVFYSAKTKDILYDKRHELYTHINRPGTVLQSFSSYLNWLTEFADKDGVTLRPSVVVTSGETLSNEAASSLSRVFACPVQNYLGSREFSIMAGRCSEGRYHLEAQDLFMEVLNEEGNDCAPGEVGKLTFTGLNSHLAPFIRYQNGDVGFTFSDNCSCGDQRVSFSFIGRSADIRPISLPDGNTILPYRFTGIFNKQYEKIRQYQVKHIAKGRYELLLVVTNAFTSVDEEAIQTEFSNLVQSNDVKILRVASIPSSGPKILPYLKTY